MTKFLAAGKKRAAQLGNAVFLILVGIMMLAALTYSISQSSEQQSNIADSAVAIDQINRLFAQAAAIGMALQGMVLSGQDALTLYTNVSTLKPGDAGFETAPHRLKIYHPMGGGIQYVDATGPATSSDTIATGFKISPGSVVTDVGFYDAPVGDILFTALISSASACQRINTMLNGSATVPVMVTVSFDSLFAGNNVTINAANCADCVGVANICVSNATATAWGYYTALLPE